MASFEGPNIALIREYLSALERGEAGSALRRFFTADARQFEMPNLLNRNGQQSDLDELIERSLKGQEMLREQSYEIVSMVENANAVAVEAIWRARLAIAMGTLAAGSEIKAAFAMFFHLRDGRISKQTNYDCFYPW